jgi:hypothetical protein
MFDSAVLKERQGVVEISLIEVRFSSTGEIEDLKERGVCRVSNDHLILGLGRMRASVGQAYWGYGSEFLAAYLRHASPFDLGVWVRYRTGWSGFSSIPAERRFGDRCW